MVPYFSILQGTCVLRSGITVSSRYYTVPEYDPIETRTFYAFYAVADDHV